MSLRRRFICWPPRRRKRKCVQCPPEDFRLAYNGESEMVVCKACHNIVTYAPWKVGLGRKRA